MGKTEFHAVLSSLTSDTPTLAQRSPPVNLMSAVLPPSHLLIAGLPKIGQPSIRPPSSPPRPSFRPCGAWGRPPRPRRRVLGRGVRKRAWGIGQGVDLREVVLSVKAGEGLRDRLEGPMALPGARRKAGGPQRLLKASVTVKRALTARVFSAQISRWYGRGPWGLFARF